MRLVLDARTASFGALIDYAGLFPPASLSMGAAVEEYRRLRASDDRWVVGRFLCPASRLEALAATATVGMQRGEPPWEIGVVFDSGPGAAASLSHAFQREMAPFMSITSAEARLNSSPSPEGLVDAIATIDPDVAAFLEVDHSADIAEQIAVVGRALRARGRMGGAKLRCGGASADLFPSIEQVTQFLWEASLDSVPFKATAGLHQPVRYHDLELDVWRHGFLNILVASVACDAGEDRGVVEEILAETDPGAFEVGAMAARWRHLVLPGSALRRSRLDGFVAFGSCDLDEPLEALKTLAFLGDGT